MCVVSMVVADWQRNQPWTHQPFSGSGSSPTVTISTVTKAEFDKLKKDFEALVKLLKAAKVYDTATGQADCEDADKVALLRRVAEALDVDIADLVKESA